MVLAVLAYLMGHAFKRTPAALVGVDFLAVLFLIVVILKCDQAEQRGRHMPFLAATVGYPSVPASSRPGSTRQSAT